MKTLFESILGSIGAGDAHLVEDVTKLLNDKVDIKHLMATYYGGKYTAFSFGSDLYIAALYLSRSVEDCIRDNDAAFLVINDDELNLLKMYPDDYMNHCQIFIFQNNTKPLDFSKLKFEDTTSEMVIRFDNCSQEFVQDTLDQIIPKSVDKSIDIKFFNTNNISLKLEKDCYLNSIHGNGVSSTKLNKIEFNMTSSGVRNYQTSIADMTINELDISNLKGEQKEYHVMCEDAVINNVKIGDYNDDKNHLYILRSQIGNLAEICDDNHIQADNQTKKKCGLDTRPKDIFKHIVENKGWVICPSFQNSKHWGRTGEHTRLFKILKVGFNVSIDNTEYNKKSSLRGDQVIYITDKQYDEYYKDRSKEQLIPHEGESFAYCKDGSLSISKVTKETGQYIQSEEGQRIMKDHVVVIPDKLLKELSK